MISMILDLNENQTLADKLLEYDDEGLRIYAGQLGLTELSGLNKEQLIEKIVVVFLQELFFRCATLSNKEMTVFKKGMNGVYEYSEEEADVVDSLNAMDLVIVSSHHMVVPSDVVKIWNRIGNDDLFRYYRKGASWIWKCMYWVKVMYAVAPIEVVLEVVRSKKGIRISEEYFLGFYSHLPKDILNILNVKNMYVSKEYITDEETLQGLSREQADKDYYIPTSAEVEELYDTGALISDKPYQDMLRFLIRDIHMDAKEARIILKDLWWDIAMSANPHDTLHGFLNKFEIQNVQQADKIASIYMTLSNETRMLVNRGHKPNELSRIRM